MNTPPDPMIVVTGVAGCESCAEALADVLIAPTSGSDIAGDCTALLGQYPGLTLILVPVDTARLAAAFRDGNLVTIDRTGGEAWSIAELIAVARHMYCRWVGGSLVLRGWARISRRHLL
jgi:hypothetical protein